MFQIVAVALLKVVNSIYKIIRATCT